MGTIGLGRALILQIKRKYERDALASRSEVKCLALDINEPVSSSFTAGDAGDVGAVALPNSWFSMDEIPKPQTLPLQEIRSRRPAFKASQLLLGIFQLRAQLSVQQSQHLRLVRAEGVSEKRFSSYSCYLLET